MYRRYYNEIASYLVEGSFWAGATDLQKSIIQKRASKYKVINGVLYHKGKGRGTDDLRLVPTCTADQYNAIRMCHIGEQSGIHFGVNKTSSILAEKFYWRMMYSDVSKFISRCPECVEFATNQSNLLKSDEQEKTNTWKLVEVELLENFHTLNHSSAHVLRLVDVYSNWTTFIPLADLDEGRMVQGILKELTSLGFPLSLRFINFRSPFVTLSCLHEELQDLVAIAKRNVLEFSVHVTMEEASETSTPTLDEYLFLYQEVLKKHQASFYVFFGSHSIAALETQGHLLQMLTNLCKDYPNTWTTKLPLLHFTIHNMVPKNTLHSPFSVMFGRHAGLFHPDPEGEEASDQGLLAESLFKPEGLTSRPKPHTCRLTKKNPILESKSLSDELAMRKNQNKESHQVSFADIERSKSKKKTNTYYEPEPKLSLEEEEILYEMYPGDIKSFEGRQNYHPINHGSNNKNYGKRSQTKVKSTPHPFLEDVNFDSVKSNLFKRLLAEQPPQTPLKQQHNAGSKGSHKLALTTLSSPPPIVYPLDSLEILGQAGPNVIVQPEVSCTPGRYSFRKNLKAKGPSSFIHRFIAISSTKRGLSQSETDSDQASPVTPKRFCPEPPLPEGVVSPLFKNPLSALNTALYGSTSSVVPATAESLSAPSSASLLRDVLSKMAPLNTKPLSMPVPLADEQDSSRELLPSVILGPPLSEASCSTKLSGSVSMEEDTMLENSTEESTSPLKLTNLIMPNADLEPESNSPKFDRVLENNWPNDAHSVENSFSHHVFKPVDPLYISDEEEDDLCMSLESIEQHLEAENVIKEGTATDSSTTEVKAETSSLSIKDISKDTICSFEALNAKKTEKETHNGKGPSKNIVKENSSEIVNTFQVKPSEETRVTSSTSSEAFLFQNLIESIHSEMLMDSQNTNYLQKENEQMEKKLESQFLNQSPAKKLDKEELLQTEKVLNNMPIKENSCKSEKKLDIEIETLGIKDQVEVACDDYVDQNEDSVAKSDEIVLTNDESKVHASTAFTMNENTVDYEPIEDSSLVSEVNNQSESEVCLLREKELLVSETPSKESSVEQTKSIPSTKLFDIPQEGNSHKELFMMELDNFEIVETNEANIKATSFNILDEPLKTLAKSDVKSDVCVEEYKNQFELKECHVLLEPLPLKLLRHASLQSLPIRTVSHPGRKVFYFRNIKLYEVKVNVKNVKSYSTALPKYTYIEERNYKCPVCPKTSLTSEGLLNLHIRFHCGIDMRQMVCPTCQKAGSNWQQMIRHYDTHEEGALELKALGVDFGRTLCRMCGKACKNKESLTYHLKTKHSNLKSNAEDLKESLPMGKVVKEFNCPAPDCPFTATTRFKLKMHREQCKFESSDPHKKSSKSDIGSFGSSFGMAALEMMIPELQFTCRKCSTFQGSSSEELEEHIRLWHPAPAPSLTAAKPLKYQCDHCSIRFSTLGMLHSHLATHQELMFFVCKLCQYKCKYKNVMNRHAKHHHPGESLRRVIQRPKMPMQTNRGKLKAAELAARKGEETIEEFVESKENVNQLGEKTQEEKDGEEDDGIPTATLVVHTDENGEIVVCNEDESQNQDEECQEGDIPQTTLIMNENGELCLEDQKLIEQEDDTQKLLYLAVEGEDFKVMDGVTFSVVDDHR